MNAEDELISIIEKKDTEIMQLNKLIELDKELEEKDNMLHNMIQGMLENGMSIESIAKMIGKDIEEIKKIQHENNI